MSSSVKQMTPGFYLNDIWVTFLKWPTDYRIFEWANIWQLCQIMVMEGGLKKDNYKITLGLISLNFPVKSSRRPSRPKDNTARSINMFILPLFHTCNFYQSKVRKILKRYHYSHAIEPMSSQKCPKIPEVDIIKLFYLEWVWGIHIW